MKQLLLVFVGGGTGSIARYLVHKYFSTISWSFPYGTFVANVLGSFLIGIILGLAAKNSTLSQQTVLLLTTGFCGGFTTFSTFAYENHLFLRSGDFLSFAIYTIGSISVALLFVFLGVFITK